MEQKVMPVRITKNDAEAVLTAYKQHLAGKPVAELNLDEWQRDVFEKIIKGIAAGKTGTQISQETGYNAFLCCEFRALKYRMRRDVKEAKNYSTRTGQIAALRLKQFFNITVDVPQQRTCPEILKMQLAGQRTHMVQGISSTNVGKIRKFLKMHAEKATIPEMISELELPEKDVIKMRRIKRESEKKFSKIVIRYGG